MRQIKDITEYKDSIPENVYVGFMELRASIQETKDSLRASIDETNKVLQETIKALDKSIFNYENRLDKAEDILKQSIFNYENRLDKAEDILKQSISDYENRMDKAEDILKQSISDYDRRMKKMYETIGAWSNNHGSFAEEYFFNSFENGKLNFFGEKFDDIEKNMKGAKKGFKDEYDIVLINGSTICIIEVKFKAHKDHIKKTLKKAATFRENFPYFASHRIFLGFATLVFTADLEKECEDEGIATVKQVGETVVINDKHLKTF